MEKYRWNKKEINYGIKNLQKQDLKNNNNLYNDLLLLKDMKKTINGINIRINKGKLNTWFSTNKQIIEILKMDFDTYITSFQDDVIINSLDNICYTDYKDICTASLKIPISFNTQKELIYKHFNNVNNHKKLFDHKEGILHTTNLNINETESLTHKDYICVRNKENVNDFKTLCHEIGHYDERLITNNRLINKKFSENIGKYDNFIEIYSIFYELLSIDILENERIITPHDATCLHNHSLLCKTSQGVFYDFSKYCVENNEIPKEDIKYARKYFTYPSDISTYYYPFLIAAILYEQNKIDPEKALYNLNYIVNNITPENEEKILNYTDCNPMNTDKIDIYTKRLKTKS